MVDQHGQSKRFSVTKREIAPVILCGGSGTRLWPLSRRVHPKQLLPLVNEQSMLQNTIARVQNISTMQPIVICNQEYRFIIAEQLCQSGFKQADIFLEPKGRNTAPAITVAAMHLINQGKDPLLFVMPADHVIGNQAQLDATVAAGAELAELGYLVTFGVVPTKPETGYGYILKGDSLANEKGYAVKRFVEKPCLEKAKEYIATNEYLWNSGMFLFRASTFLKAMQEHAPDIYTACENVIKHVEIDLDFHRLGNDFENVRSESIDFAVMEKASNIAVVPLKSDWSDVGSWDVLWDISEKDQEGNVKRGSVYTENVTNSYLRADKRLVGVVGLSNIAVIETPDAILVANKDSCQDIKALVNAMQSQEREEAEIHSRAYRPWGYYESLSKSESYQVKHICVNPGAKLSLQMHYHRSEHWVIIKGTAIVTHGEEEIELTANQSIYIPVTVKHRMENRTSEPLHFIEVQTGDYFGEDDIVRFEDIYGRKEEKL